MTLQELERGLEIHEKQIQEMGTALTKASNLLGGTVGRLENHEKQMQELRDNQVVQGTILAKVSNLLVGVATRVSEIAER